MPSDFMAGRFIGANQRYPERFGYIFSARKQPSFYPQVQVTFTVGDAGQHYHIPLLLSPFGYSTYRGS